MSEKNDKELYLNFDEYIRQGEPSQREAAYAWSTAIGLQAVDGLKTSEYLNGLARRNIEGEITIDEVEQLLNTVFEHENCVSIKPFYHKWEGGGDNYLELVQNISRNFTNMRLFRDRVVNKEQCKTM